MDVNEKFDLILAYNFRMSTLFLINYHFKRINFCVKSASTLRLSLLRQFIRLLGKVACYLMSRPNRF